MTLLFIEKSIHTYIYIYSYILIVKARNEEYFFVQFIHRCGGRRERERDRLRALYAAVYSGISQWRVVGGDESRRILERGVPRA